MVLWAKLSKTVKPSQALDPGLNRFESKLQHFSMSWPARRQNLGLCLCQGQLEAGPLDCTLLLLGAQYRLRHFLPLGFFLLGFHRLALEPARHNLTLAEIVPIS